MPAPPLPPGIFEVLYRDGVYLSELDLWLDPYQSRQRAFVSHASADHFPRHERILCSRPTFELLAARHGLAREQAVILDFGQRYAFRKRYEVQLFPAGHVPGSAQLHVTRRSDGATLLYTGDFKLRRSLSAEPLAYAPADTLILETTFGLPHFRFPPAEQVLEQVVRFCREAIEEGDVPVLVGYSLGKARDLLLALQEAGLPVMLHRSVQAMAAGVSTWMPDMPRCRDLDPAAASGHVLVAPSSALRSPLLRRVRRQRSAVLTGWAMRAGAKHRYQVDEAFPLSDHADYNELVRYVEMVQPRRIWTLHGYALEFARDLRERGYEAWTLPRNDQMDLPLDLAKDSAPENSVALLLTRVPCPFSDFVDVCERIGSSLGNQRKVQILGRYLLTLSEANLQRAALYMSGRVFPGCEERRQLQADWALIRKALLQVSGLSESRFRELSATQNDAGRTAFLALQGCTRPRATSLAELATFFRRLAEAQGVQAKVEILAERLRFLHPLEAKVLVQILAGDLPAGLTDALLEEGIAQAFRQPADDVRRAHMLLGDPGTTALFAKRNLLTEAALTPFTPVQCMVAAAAESSDAVWERMGSGAGASTHGGFWLEEKQDGIRVQLHRVGERVALYASRDLRSLGDEFPEVAEAARSGLGNDVILDGELIAYAEGRRLSSQDLQKLGGITGMESDLFLGGNAKVQFVISDLLWVDGASLMDHPLCQRREILESLPLPESFRCVDRVYASHPREIDRALQEARRRGNEGLIAKHAASFYCPGRRGRSWLELKRTPGTLDVVVVQVRRGPGWRPDAFGDLTLAVRDAANNSLVAIGRTDSGLSAAEMESLASDLAGRALRKNCSTCPVEPTVVLEVAFDSIRPSRRNRSGLALRSARIRAIRHDKTVEEIDTLETARLLAGLPG